MNLVHGPFMMNEKKKKQKRSNTEQRKHNTQQRSNISYCFRIDR